MQNWWQQVLIEPEVVECRLVFGVVKTADHVQWMIEVVDPVTGVQVAQVANPHGSFTELALHLGEAVARFKSEVHAAVAPF